MWIDIRQYLYWIDCCRVHIGLRGLFPAERARREWLSSGDHRAADSSLRDRHLSSAAQDPSISQNRCISLCSRCTRSAHDRFHLDCWCLCLSQPHCHCTDVHAFRSDLRIRLWKFAFYFLFLFLFLIHFFWLLSYYKEMFFYFYF